MSRTPRPACAHTGAHARSAAAWAAWAQPLVTAPYVSAKGHVSEMNVGMQVAFGLSGGAYGSDGAYSWLNTIMHGPSGSKSSRMRPLASWKV